MRIEDALPFAPLSCVRIMLLCIFVFSLGDGSLALAQPREIVLPAIVANDTKGLAIALREEELCNFELELRRQFGQANAPDEIVAFACGRPAHILMPTLGLPVGVTTISIHGKTGELRSYFEDAPERFYYRKLSEIEITSIRSFISDNKVDDLPELPAEKLGADGRKTTDVGGAQYVYLRLSERGGRRVLINNPPFDAGDAPPDDPSWRYSKVVAFLEKLDDEEGGIQEMRYAFPRPIKDLDVVYAPRISEVLSVWKQNADLCITVRKKWGRDMVERHHVLRGDKIAEETADPKRQVKYSVEENGSTLRQARESANARFVIGNRLDTGDLECHDRHKRNTVTLADTAIRTTGYPLYYLEAHRVFLLGRLSTRRILDTRGGFDRHEWSDLAVLDPTSGKVAEVDSLAGVDLSSFPPASLWFQNLPHRMQPVRGRENLVWAAIPEHNGTQVGQFDLKQMSWSRGDYVPNLKFETKHLWVDEAQRKIYIVYKGHLLSVPLAHQFGDNEGES